MTDPFDEPQNPARLRFSLGATAEGRDPQGRDSHGRYSEDRGQAWIRRLGASQPEKLSSGNWRYRDTDVARLRLVSDLVSQGVDPKELIDLSLGELERRATQISHGRGGSADFAELDTERAFRFIESYDADGLLDQLLEIGSAREACAFVEQDLAPLLVEIGQRWSVGALDVPQEKLASETIQSLLHQLGARMQQSPESKHHEARVTVVLAGLPGERHELPLQMVAYVAELAGARCVLLGADVTTDSIARSAMLAEADMVAIHTSGVGEARATHWLIAELRDRLPDSVALVVGGGGRVQGEGVGAGVKIIDSLSDFEALIVDQVNG